MKIRISDELNRTRKIIEVDNFFEIVKISNNYEYWEYI